MHISKPFTNTTFTKRVDHEGGRHRPARARSEPAICKQCGAVYANRRWTTQASVDGENHLDHRSAEVTVCPACKQERSGEPRGFVYLDGDFVEEHGPEFERLLFNEANRAREDNPLARILELKEGNGHKLIVTTTTEHLAQRLGHAVEKAFSGKAHYNFGHEDKIARVSWRRD